MASPGAFLQETPDPPRESDGADPSPSMPASAETKGLSADIEMSSLDLSDRPKERNTDLYTIQENKYIYELDENGNQFNVCYPSFLCQDEVIANKINTILYNLAFNNLDIKNIEQLYNLQISTKYYIMYSDSNLVSILFETNVYDAFHAHAFYNALTFDPVHGTLVKLTDLGVDYDSIEILINDPVTVSSSFDVTTYDIWAQLLSDYKNYTDPLNNFYLSDNDRFGFIFLAGGTLPDNIIVEVDLALSWDGSHGPGKTEGTGRVDPE